jgi:hypothetical protein
VHSPPLRLSQERADAGGWLLFLFDFMANRLPPSQHVATDEEAVGIFFDLTTEEEKQVRARARVDVIRPRMRGAVVTAQLHGARSAQRGL